MSRRPERQPEDLTPYAACDDAEAIGLTPLGVGWLDRRRPFATGAAPAGLLERLLPFCEEPAVVCPFVTQQPCPLCGQRITLDLAGRQLPLGQAELRVIGAEDVYAAPTLIYHFIEAHRYRPPAEFVQAVLHGPPPGSAEHRALVNTLRHVIRLGRR